MAGSIHQWSSINDQVLFKVEVPVISYVSSRQADSFDMPMTFLKLEGEASDSSHQSGLYLQGEHMSQESDSISQINSKIIIRTSNVSQSNVVHQPARVISLDQPARQEEEKVSLARPRESQELRCLIVHDNIVELLLVEFLFQKQGFKVARANNSLEASSLVDNDQTSFEIIIVGLNMQHSSGFETCRSIYSWFHGEKAKLRRCPYLVALSTAPVTPVLAQKCHEMGFHQLIGSPLTLSKIQDELVPLFEQYRSQGRN